jgi:hypothetical protein
MSLFDLPVLIHKNLHPKSCLQSTLQLHVRITTPNVSARQFVTSLISISSVLTTAHAEFGQISNQESHIYKNIYLIKFAYPRSDCMLKLYGKVMNVFNDINRNKLLDKFVFASTRICTINLLQFSFNFTHSHEARWPKHSPNHSQ